jgi:hypothetical protein
MFEHLIAWFRGKRGARSSEYAYERRIHVRWDESGMAVTFPEGGVRAIGWPEVERIVIITNDTGPHGSDVWWLIEGADKRCAYPQGASGDEAALAEMQRRFPGFDNKAVIEAMGCTTDGRFVCWERPATT